MKCKACKRKSTNGGPFCRECIIIKNEIRRDKQKEHILKADRRRDV